MAETPSTHLKGSEDQLQDIASDTDSHSLAASEYQQTDIAERSEDVHAPGDISIDHAGPDNAAAKVDQGISAPLAIKGKGVARRAHSEADNLKIEAMIKMGVKPSDIVKAMPNVSRTNIYSKIRRFTTTGSVLRDKAEYKPLGRPKTLTSDVDSFVSGVLAGNPDIELSQISAVLKEHKGVSVSSTSISRAVARVTGQKRDKGVKSRRLGEKKRAAQLAERERKANEGRKDPAIFHESSRQVAPDVQEEEAHRPEQSLPGVAELSPMFGLRQVQTANQNDYKPMLDPRLAADGQHAPEE